MRVERQVPVRIELRDISFEEGFRADVIVDGKVLLELKSVEHVTNAHKKQVLTYLRLTGLKTRLSAQFRRGLDEGRDYAHHQR